MSDISTARWRPEVIAFADLMEAQLRANDHKPGWKDDLACDLLPRLREETDEKPKTGAVCIVERPPPFDCLNTREYRGFRQSGGGQSHPSVT